MRFIKYIVIHCSAGFGDVDAIRRYWRQTLGWRMDGYNRFIYTTGEIVEMQPWEQVTNGVLGYNTSCLHICYQGGVLRENVRVAADTRTHEQKESILKAIGDAYRWLSQYQGVSGVKILGHRDFSPDQNGNGIIESWERIKECPSFDARTEYAWIQGNDALKSLSIL